MPYSRPCGVLYSTVKQTSFPISFFRRNSRAGNPQGWKERKESSGHQLPPGCPGLAHAAVPVVRVRSWHGSSVAVPGTSLRPRPSVPIPPAPEARARLTAAPGRAQPHSTAEAGGWRKWSGGENMTC